MRRLLLASLVSCLISNSGQGDDWPNWRGPTGRGVAVAVDYPTQWSVETDVLWKAQLPGRGSSTPAVRNGLIFVTCAEPEAGANAIVCLDADGTIKWTTNVGRSRAGKHKKATGANSSPVIDDDRVFCYFKSGDLACVDFSGEMIWHANLQERFGADSLWWDLGTSPVLAGQLLIVACVQSGDSYVVAFDKTSGNVVWKVDRNLPAPQEATQSYSTPCLVPAEDGAPEQLVVLGADHITGHRVADGAEAWRVGDLNPDQNAFFRSISSPVHHDDMVFACYARGGSLTAVRIGGSGDVTDTHVVWSREGEFSDVPTPAVDAGHLYVCSDRGRVACLDAATGEEQWEVRLKGFRGAISASPILAGKLLYIVAEDGKTFALSTDDGSVVGRGDIDALVVATPVLVDGRMLLRTPEHVVCIGQ